MFKDVFINILSNKNVLKIYFYLLIIVNKSDIMFFILFLNWEEFFMINQNIRNIAIIAHVDHGKTSLVNELLKQGHVFHENQVVEDRVMD